MSLRAAPQLSDETIDWEWEGTRIQLGLTRFGTGRKLLLLPSLSSISTRHEMLGLQQRLGSSFETISIDWPGFGDLPRPSVAWTPQALRAFLAHLPDRVGSPFATAAAGHAAGYCIGQAAEAPGLLGLLCLVAPTWRGPLPTMMGGRRPWFSSVARAVDRPVTGAALYRLNVNRPMIGIMARGHVYSDACFLTREWIRDKKRVVTARGARHASFRFVSGLLDPFESREAFLEAASDCGPALVVHAAETPRKSRAEMRALSQLPNIEDVELPVGKLGVHEEFPDEVAEAILGFLRRHGA